MARTSLADHLQAYPFWLTDVAPIEPLALPIFSPLSGFSAITSPEMTLEMYDVNEANWFFSKSVVKKASVTNLTLQRAASWWDADFYRWVMTALTGDTGGTPQPSRTTPTSATMSSTFQRGGPTPRRDLLLIQFLSSSPLPTGTSPSLAAAAQAAAVLSISGAGGGVNTGAGGAVLQGALTAGVAAVNVGFGLVEFSPRFPAKAWMLYGCMPVRYKTGSDFDATSAEVSIQELEIAYDYFDEISLSIA
jgi:phage tail-like protein